MIKKSIAFILPWRLKRWFLVRFFGYKIDPTARIGFAWVFPKMLTMESGSKIGHLTIAIHLDRINMGHDSSIGRSNWITGFPTSGKSLHFTHQHETRKSELLLGNHSAITKHHHIDCTNSIIIGKFVTVAGYYSQLLTHSIDIEAGIQDSYPIRIGDYCFIGTNSVILGGARLPAYSVLGAKSLLNKAFDQEYALYAGAPATFIKTLNKEAKYFSRTTGYVI